MKLQNTRGRTIRFRRLFAYALTACSFALAAPLVAHAAAVQYVALGDSYTSGPLTGVPATGVPESCLQSVNDYPHLVASAIQAASFTDVSCSGAEIANMSDPQTNVLGQGTNAPQFDSLSRSTTLVTVGISANDAKVFGVAVNCAEIDLTHPTGSDCEAHYTVGGVEQISQAIAQTAPILGAAYHTIHLLAPHARVLAIGYPDLLPVGGATCLTSVPISAGDIAYVNYLIDALNKMIDTTATANGVQYVDTYTPTIGHDVCQPAGVAAFTGVLPNPGLNALHPNAFGEQLMSDAVLKALYGPHGITHSARAKLSLKLTQASIGRTSVTASGTISRFYHGRVAITFEGHYHGHAIALHDTATVAHGHIHARLPIPRRYVGALHGGTVIARTKAEKGLAAATARAYIR